MVKREYKWGTRVSTLMGEAIYIAPNPQFRDDAVDGKHLVIFKNKEDIEEINKIRPMKSNPKPHKGLMWGDKVRVWDDKYDKPLNAIYLATYKYPGETLYVAIPYNFTKVPSEGYLHCEKVE